jgi:choline dehydrogenase-like flavoprotein
MMQPEDFHFHAWPYDFPQRQKPEPFYPPEHRAAIRYENCDHISVDRIRAVGGRSIHWNAVCLRFAARDFRERSLAGIEEDWPLTYQELAPFYSYVERMIGVCGSRENLDIVPDGDYPLPPLKFRCSEEIVKRACDRLQIPMIPVRKALNTQAYDDRPPCHYCGHCMEGCDASAIFSVPGSMLPKAQKTGNFTLIPNQCARELLVDTAGKVRAVSVIDTVTKKEQEISARVFAVCCATIESVRLLLNSRSARHPNGLANSSDLVGRYLTGHVTAGAIGYLEDLIGTKPINNDGATDHTYIPRYNLDGKKRDYLGGYHYQIQFSSFMFPQHARYLKGFGKPFKKQVRTLQPGFFQMGGFGKVMAQRENRVTVDPNHLDAYGIPIPVVHFRFHENDRALWKDMRQQAEEILHNARARTIISDDSGPTGFASHETGTARMGSDPRKSVLNAHCQAHDVKNLFVVDGSCFTTFPEKNPTLTIMALAVRASRYMSDELRKHNI